jgi:hypothetical protein
LTPRGKLTKWFKNNILSDFRTDGGIDSDGLKSRLEKDGYDSGVIEKAIELAEQKPKPPKPIKPDTDWDLSSLSDASSSDEEQKLQAPTISANKSQNAIDRVMADLPKNSFSREDVENLLRDGMSETDIISFGKDHDSQSEHAQIDQSPEEEYLPAKKGIKSLEEYLREAEGDGTDPSTGKPSSTPSTGKPSSTPSTGKPSSTPVAVPINDDQAAKKLLDMMDEHAGIEWRHKTFLDLETGNQFENPLEIMDEDLNKWADDIVAVWKRQKKITQLSEEDVENMANFHLDDMGFTAPGGDPEKIDWFTKRHSTKTLDQIQKIQ